MHWVHSHGMNTTELEVIVNETKITDTGIYSELTCGKVSAFVCITDYEFRVICQNAAHKCWKGSGRAFRSASEALEAYRKPEMKAIISAADKLNA